MMANVFSKHRHSPVFLEGRFTGALRIFLMYSSQVLKESVLVQNLSGKQWIEILEDPLCGPKMTGVCLRLSVLMKW